MSNKTTNYNDLCLPEEPYDAVIKVEDVEFHIHKVVLCNCSMYFSALFRDCWSERNQRVYSIPGISSDMMQLIITFAYNGSVSVSEENVQELLQAADYLNVTDIIQVCCEFLGDQLCPENCIGIYQLTNSIFNMELRLKAYNYIIEHFEEVLSSEEFLQLSVNELASLMVNDELQVKERQLFEAVIHWINHNRTERERHFRRLLKLIRLGSPSAGAHYINTNVMPHELVRNNYVLRNVVRASLFLPFSASSSIVFPFSRPRLPPAILLAIEGSGFTGLPNRIEAYDCRANHWVTETRHDSRHLALHASIVFHNGNLFSIGGTNYIKHFNSVFRLDLSADRWHVAERMHYRRFNLSVTVLDGFIYAMGGYDGRNYLNYAERYRPETNQWSDIAHMNEQRSKASCTTLNNKIYICGGLSSLGHLQTCEYYTPESNQWTIFRPMLSPRSGLGVTAYAGHVYAVGGFDGNNCLSSVESYSPTTDTWHALPSMLSPRRDFGIAVMDDCIFAVGGISGNKAINHVEYYDLLTNQWSEASAMYRYRCYFNCCVVPVMNRFIIPRDKMMQELAEEDPEERRIQ